MDPLLATRSRSLNVSDLCHPLILWALLTKYTQAIREQSGLATETANAKVAAQILEEKSRAAEVEVCAPPITRIGSEKIGLGGVASDYFKASRFMGAFVLIASMLLLPS